MTGVWPLADVAEARDILESLGMPSAQHNQIAGMTLIALCGLSPSTSWSAAIRRRCTVTRDIMDYLREHYDSDYAPNTRETFRRQVLHQFVQAGIAEYNPFDPELPTNSPNTHYAVTEAVLRVIRCYATEGWDEALEQFRREQGSLVERYARDRIASKIPIKTPDGTELFLSPGRHNELQQMIIDEFAPRFAPGARLLYLGDTAKKDLLVDSIGLANLGIPISDDGKLPDVVLFDEEREWLFLVEAVTSHGPVSPTRLVDLEAMLSDCRVGIVFVSAFPDLKEFSRHIRNIAWETEVWISESPSHLIHYDGDRFLGPRLRS